MVAGAVQLSLADDGGMTGDWMVRKADEWVAANWYAWCRMKGIAWGYVNEGRRFSMERLFQEARYDMATNGCSDGFKVNNNTRAALARRLVREIPAAGKYIETRSSKVDWL